MVPETYDDPIDVLIVYDTMGMCCKLTKFKSPLAFLLDSSAWNLCYAINEKITLPP